jgi:hypothetical protein
MKRLDLPSHFGAGGDAISAAAKDQILQFGKHAAR